MDDEIEHSKVLSTIINEDQHFQCNICESGEEALSILEKDVFQCIFLDLIMPNIGGLQVLKSIQEKKINTKVVVLSGYLNDKLIQECKKFGAYHVLNKPPEIHIIKSILKRIVAL